MLPKAEQVAPVGKEASKDKDTPTPSKEGVPQLGKDKKQTAVSSMGDPTPKGNMAGLYR